MRVLVVFWVVILFWGGEAQKSEVDWLAKTIHVKGDPTMIYVIVTNRPYSETHGNGSQPVTPPPPTNGTVTEPVPAPGVMPVPAPSKRFVNEIEQGNGTEPEPVPEPGPGSPEPTASPQPIGPIPPPSDIWLKSIFIPKVDQISLLKPSNFTWDNLHTIYSQWKDLRVYLQFGNGTSAIKSSRKRFWSGNLVVGSFSAYVSLNSGKVTAINWDDGCQECDSDHCLDNVCAFDEEKCTGRNCDLKIYLAWIGTDANNIYCTSAGTLPSNFQTFSFGTIFDYAAQAAYNPALTIWSH
jgi:hypothetical protein